MTRYNEKSERRKKIIMTSIVVFLMTSSVIGYMIGSESEEYDKYGDYKFFRVGNKWLLKTDKGELNFYYFPTQVKTINISESVLDTIKNSLQIDMTSDINSSYKESIALSQFELSNALVLNNQYLRTGFTTENEFNIEVITCEDATVNVPVMMFEKSNETRAYSLGNCIILKGRSDLDFIAFKDRIVYEVFGII